MVAPNYLIPHFTDHEGRVSRFIEQFSKKPNLDALTKSYLKQVQDLEDAMFEVLLKRELENAVGVQLTILGKIVQQPRTTADDNRFRTAIRARIAINLSHATAFDLIKVAGLILQEFGETFEIRDEPPAQVRVTVIDPLTSADADLMFTLLEETDAAGVRLVLQWNSALATAADKLLCSDTVTGNTFGAGGLGSTTGAVTTPGKLDSVIGG